MRALHKFFSLTSQDRLLLVRAFGRLVEATIVVHFLPYRVLRGRLEENPICSNAQSGEAAAKRVVWAIEAVGRRMPGATCLVKALAARSMLARCGYATDLRIGVSKDAAKRFIAHAWLEWRGSILLGGEQSPLQYEMMDLRPRSMGSG
ncbi:MAG TPA: lasso peptide biosynthesis B2 protein [Terracidiphilus sp.]|nr:lasso peptide biosynthesis B2 protein [Terracidiphilus sp.]